MMKHRKTISAKSEVTVSIIVDEKFCKDHKLSEVRYPCHLTRN
jgi:hypothetical protein